MRWTYSDLFEEPGPPTTPFHGGFGLINCEGIPKPAYFAYKYLNQLRGRLVPVNDEHLLAATEVGRTAVLLWDWNQPEQDLSNRPFFTRILPATARPDAEIRFSSLAPGTYRLRVHRTGYQANDACTRYLEMGRPEAQLGQLRELARDLPETSRTVRVGSDGLFDLHMPMRSNDVVLVMLDRADGSESR